MVNIDYIMELLDWNKTDSEQRYGIALAKNVQSINVFLQPCNSTINKNVWENCAIVLAEKSDEDLSPYLGELLAWLQDMNWPGAFRILNRLQEYSDTSSLNRIIGRCTQCARALGDVTWQNNLSLVKPQSNQ